jgi:hypothetical protein
MFERMRLIKNGAHIQMQCDGRVIMDHRPSGRPVWCHTVRPCTGRKLTRPDADGLNIGPHVVNGSRQRQYVGSREGNEPSETS